ncbi:MAG: hypothetical protein IKX03_00965, partial [Bacteroidales bacterium]|nr:hypothetical protein [Bacteroidales bacterium]
SAAAAAYPLFPYVKCHTSGPRKYTKPSRIPMTTSPIRTHFATSANSEPSMTRPKHSPITATTTAAITATQTATRFTNFLSSI